MASKQEQKLPLTLLIDKEKNQVVVAEANGDFIDTLFSFLTLPLGTITRLVSKNQPQQRTLSCIKNLYKSVENFSDDVFFNSICKKMLLYPRNSCELLCQKLKLNVDDTEITKYFICSTCEGKGLLSTFLGASCSCGKLMDKKVKLNEDVSDRDCVFVKKETMYLIFDDLKVLQQFGHKNINMMTHISTTVGLKEILDLLNKSLTSKTPLTDVFLAKNGELYIYQMFTFSSNYQRCQLRFNFLSDNDDDDDDDGDIIKDIKVTVSKSKKKILYAEVREGFVDFLSSFLTTPLGSILNQLNGKFSFGCIDNLHKSVKELPSSCFTMSVNNPLPKPDVAFQFDCKQQPLKYIREEAAPTATDYRYCDNGLVYVPASYCSKKNKFKHKEGLIMQYFHPKSPSNGSYFEKRPTQFVVWDNLEVTPLENTTSSIAFLLKLNLSLDDLEEHVMSIGEKEAQYLLGAALTSSQSALTEALFHLLEEKATA